jgi:ubiquinone/menaquinone biosynthesis C-methylase UbiE
METTDYILRGGSEGRERLRILSRVMRPTTLELLKRAGIAPGMNCLDVACGGGDVACDMAKMVAPSGNVVATDIDKLQLEIAWGEAQQKNLTNIEFRYADITADSFDVKFDLVHARFILHHLADPGAAVRRMRTALKRDGVLVVQDVDVGGWFCYPDCPAFLRFIELYRETARRRGANACIGRQLPSILSKAGFEDVHVNIVQPAGVAGEVKLIAPLTMQYVGSAVLASGLAGQKEIDDLVDALFTHARTERTLGSMPPVIEAWAMNGAPMGQ